MMISMRLIDLYTIFHACENKKIIIFGSNKIAEHFIEKIRLFGMEPAYCIDFYNNLGQRYCAGLKILGYYEILKEVEKVYVLLTEMKGQNKQAYALEDMGYEYLKDYNFISGAYRQGKLNASSPLDPNLGFGSAKSETNIDGAKIFGNVDTAKYKIAIMGGSVAESCFYSWKTWPEILYEKLTERGESVSIISGGVIGYTSSRVLLKFIRDMLPYKPDMVIDYNVLLNDSTYDLNLQTPYVSGYQKKMMNLLHNNIKDIYMEKTVIESNFGNQHNKDAVEVLIENIRILKAICAEFNIKYVCILHPSIYTKKLDSYKEKELYQLCDKGHIDRSMKFYERLEEEMRLHSMDYVIDGRGWTDEYSDIYYDYCHMYEEGNMIIANKMLKVVDEILIK